MNKLVINTICLLVCFQFEANGIYIEQEYENNVIENTRNIYKMSFCYNI